MALVLEQLSLGRLPLGQLPCRTIPRGSCPVTVALDDIAREQYSMDIVILKRTIVAYILRANTRG